MTNGANLTNLLLAFSLVFFSGNPLNAAGYKCQYLDDSRSKLTKFIFSLDLNPKFGTIIPIEIINSEEQDHLKIKTVVIKDKPFAVLTDVQRINNQDDSMLFVYIYPERNRIKILNINGGIKPNISLRYANCSKIYE
jgi:hypothetical protein